MEKQDELDDEKYAYRDAKEANFALMTFTLSDSESEFGSCSESDGEDKVSLTYLGLILFMISRYFVKIRQGT